MFWKRRRQREQDLSDEIQAHLALATRERIARGEPAPAAARGARCELGNPVAIHEETRESWGGQAVENMMRDLRYAVRSFRRTPAFTIIAILTLALGIGANTAIFSLLYGILLRPLPYPAPDRLVVLKEALPQWAARFGPALPVSANEFLEWRRQSTTLEQVSLLDPLSVNLTGGGEPERINGARVSATLFPLLGVRTQLGRLFGEAEDQDGRDKVIVISDTFWRSRFHADPSVVGRKVLFNGSPYEVIGVLAPDAQMPVLNEIEAMPSPAGDAAPDQFWKPFGLKKDEIIEGSDFDYACLARLRVGVSADQALQELNAIQARISAGWLAKFGKGNEIELKAHVVPLHEQIAGKLRKGLLLLLAAVGAVLLIGCVNIANLLLARGAARQREMAIRTAVGASRSRLVRQVLVESTTLAITGGAVGVALAWWALRAILAFAPVELPRRADIAIDPYVLAFAAVLAVGAGILCGIVPGLRTSRVEPQEALKSGSHTTSGAANARFRGVLVGAEVCLSTVCLVAAGLLLHSFVRLMNVDKGFDAERAVAAELNLPPARYPDTAARYRLVQSVIDRIQPLPGVTAAGSTNKLPLTGEGSNNGVIVEGVNRPLAETPIADSRFITPGFLRAIGIPLVSGRNFSELDKNHGVALVSMTAATRLWPGQDPIGKRLKIGGGERPWEEVIGIVGDVRNADLRTSPPMTVYLPAWERDRQTAILVVRTANDPAGIVAAVRSVVRELDPELPLARLHTLEDVVASSVAPRRFQLTLVGVFAALALLLAGIGIYGVVSYSVSQRRNEMGIRMALGARPAQVRALVLGQGLRPVAGGLAAGLACSLVIGRFLQSLLYEVGTMDPVTLAGVTAVLFLVSAAACFIPAVRITRLNPSITLRCE